MNCICGEPVELKFPIPIIGITELNVAIILYTCKCGFAIHMSLETMKPYIADRCNVFPANRGEYQVAPGGGVNFTCPICKCSFGLRPSSVHTILDNGEITPSVICPNGCGFHTWMTLKDWRREK